MKETDPEQLYIEKRGKLRLFAGFLGAPAIWLVQLQTNYMLVTAACESGTNLPLYISSLIFLAAAVGAGVLSWGNWMRAGISAESSAFRPIWPGPEDGSILARSRFMAMLGIATSAFFTLLIVAQAMAILIIDPCLE